MDSSVYCLPADLLGEGAAQVAAQLRDRAGGPGLPSPGLPSPGLPSPGLPSPGLTVAAAYHASRDILPHNPVYRVASMAPGAFYQVDSSAYPGPLRPVPSPSADGRDILAEACQAAEPLGLPVSAWAVILHRDDLSASGPDVQENCFGDRFPGRLCPAKPAVRDYALAMVRDLCRYPVTTLRAEALHYQGASHGHHHERCLKDYGELARWLLGLCFCFDPGHVAVRAEMGVAPEALTRAGVHLEEPVYLTAPAAAQAAIAWYRTQIGPSAPLTVLLRPGPPDTPTPASRSEDPRSEDPLREKAAAARAHNCTELNFYTYGLYRLQALAKVRQALSPP